MKKTRLGRTNIWVSRTAFGALPIQRVGFETAKVILRQAYEGGITFFDTARGYSDSEEKLGYALSDVRKDIVISTKSSGASDKSSLLQRLEISLNNLKTDYVDLLQLHNPATLPDPDDPNSLYAGLLEAQDSRALLALAQIPSTGPLPAALEVAPVEQPLAVGTGHGEGAAPA